GQTPEGAVANFFSLFVKLPGLEMISYQRDHLGAHVVTIKRVNFKSIQKSSCWRRACILVTTRAQTSFDKLSSCRLPKIVRDCGEHDSHLLRVRQVVDQLSCTISNQPGVNENIAFGVPLL